MKKPLTIAIDGPAGAGKSTVARLLARQLQYLYIDSGAMYRTIALLTKRGDITDPDEVSAIARSASICFAPAFGDGDQRVLLADEDVTAEIRTPDIASQASVISSIPGVRAALVAQQQELGKTGGVVMEGRDIGTVVLPNAEFKFFLTASAEERAARRFKDLQSRGLGASTLEAVRADQDERDRRDTTRAVSPLIAAADAILIETDGLSPLEIANAVIAIIERRLQGN